MCKILFDLGKFEFKMMKFKLACVDCKYKFVNSPALYSVQSKHQFDTRKNYHTIGNSADNSEQSMSEVYQ